MTVNVYKPSVFRVRAEGSRVVLCIDGRRVLDVHWSKADDIARYLTRKARQAEEHEKADAIAYDGAILLRAGAPIGLTDHPKIREEVCKIAAWDSRLRRYMRRGIKATRLPGVPRLIVRPPSKTGETP